MFKADITIAAKTFTAGEESSIVCFAVDTFGTTAELTINIENSETGTLSGKVLARQNRNSLRLVPVGDDGKRITTSGCKWIYKSVTSTSEGTVCETAGTKTDEYSYEKNNVLTIY